MPTRMLRDWTDSLKFDGISADAERMFVRIIMKADDYGRFHADPRLIKANCFPLIENLRPNDLNRWLDELSTRQLILRYETDGRNLLAVVNYGQRLKSSRAKFPPLPGKTADWLPVSEDFREVPGSSGNIRLEEKGSRREVEADLETEVHLETETPKPPEGDGQGDDLIISIKANPKPPTQRILPNNWERMSATAQKQTRVNLNSEAMAKIGKLLGRKAETLWTVAEAVALKNINPSADEIELMAVYYGAHIEQDRDYRRRDLLTLLNNWNGELDRARIFKSSNS